MDRLMSPRPNSLLWPGANSGWWISGMMVRVIRFQSSFRENGTTGWILVMFWVFSSGP
jgi:hypothetical protein